MKLRERYRRLTLLNKICFWGAVLAFPSIILTVYFRCIPSSYETEMLERTKAVQNQTASRILSPDQKRIIIKRIKVFESGSLSIQVVASDIEALQFARNLEALFKTAGWEVKSLAITNLVGYGLDIWAGSSQSLEKARAISEAFDAAGLDARISNKGVNFDNVIITVGSKQ